jgi:phosphoenolpyruvate carboxykinase (GTP)
VLEWVFERASGRGDAVDTPIGYVPTPTAINVDGLDVTLNDMEELLTVDAAEWRDEVASIREHYVQFGDRLPDELIKQVNDLEARLT